MPQLAEEDSPPVTHCAGDRLPGSYLLTRPDAWCAGVPGGTIAQHSTAQCSTDYGTAQKNSTDVNDWSTMSDRYYLCLAKRL
mgnify:CR=1 FL=1